MPVRSCFVLFVLTLSGKTSLQTPILKVPISSDRQSSLTWARLEREQSQLLWSFYQSQGSIDTTYQALSRVTDLTCLWYQENVQGTVEPPLLQAWGIQWPEQGAGHHCIWSSFKAETWTPFTIYLPIGAWPFPFSRVSADMAMPHPPAYGNWPMPWKR